MSGPLYNEYGDINYEDEAVPKNMNKRKIYDNLEKMDSGFIQIPIVYYDKYKNKSITKKVGCYMSGGPGSFIKNAVTGQKYPEHYVGKFDEELYFKAMLCSGENGSDPVTLFFESPSQYEKHFFRTLPDKTKDDWFKRLDSLQS
jgi:hypothetical protein